MFWMFASRLNWQYFLLLLFFLRKFTKMSSGASMVSTRKTGYPKKKGCGERLLGITQMAFPYQ